MIDLQLQRRVAFVEARGLHLACCIQHKGALELEPQIHVRMRRGLRGAATYVYRHIYTSNKNLHFEMILDVGIGEKKKRKQM